MAVKWSGASHCVEKEGKTVYVEQSSLNLNEAIVPNENWF